MRPNLTAVLGRGQRIDVVAAESADFKAGYGDAFRIGAVPGVSAREWARVSLRGAEAANRMFARLAWHGVLGFDLASRGAAQTLVGWHITTDEPNRLVLDTDGRLMAGRIVFALADDTVTWTTLVRFHRTAGHCLWAIAGIVHRALVPRLLTNAHQSLSRRAANR